MITIRPVYDCLRPSRTQLWGVFADGILSVITMSYPDWVTK